MQTKITTGFTNVDRFQIKKQSKDSQALSNSRNVDVKNKHDNPC